VLNLCVTESIIENPYFRDQAVEKLISAEPLPYVYRRGAVLDAHLRRSLRGNEPSVTIDPRSFLLNSYRQITPFTSR
jgi:hypothetical protein